MIYWDPTGHVAKKYVEDYFYSLTTGERYPRCKIGSAGSYVYQMEQMLEYAGYHPGDSNDGIFDGCTLSAVRLFQQDNGLKVTGIVEQKAWAYLEIQPQLKRLESSYNRGDIRKEEYEAQVGGLKRMANNVPYKYDDRTLEAAKRELYSRFYVGLVVEKSLLELQAMVLTMGTSEIMGDGADLLYDVSNAIVNPNPNAVGSIVYDSVCLLVPDGPLNYADNVVDDVADLGKRAGKSGSNTNKLFKNQSLLNEHYGKHGQEIADVLGDSNYSIDKYLDDANYIIKNGTFTPELNGYVSFMSGKKYGFVGLDRTTGDITTFHIKNISELIKKAPGLGFER